MPIPEIQQRLRRAFPETTDPATVAAVLNGVRLADDLIGREPLLGTLIGRDYRGLLRRAGVLFSFQEACQAGHLPFTASFRPMHRGHWHLLEIASGDEKAQICRTDDADSFPVDGPVRQDERLVNQFDLFEPLPPMPELLLRIPHLYVWLTFGADREGNLTHVCWTAPAREGREWLGFASILRNAMQVLERPAAEAAPDPRKKLRFREHIETALEDKNDTKSSGR